MITKLCAAGLLSAILVTFLGELGFKNKKLLSLLTAVLLLGALKSGVDEITRKIISLSDLAGISDACYTALKAVGLGYLFGITADICTELGESAVAKALTLVGRVEILLVTLPYFEKTVDLGLELLR